MPHALFVLEIPAKIYNQTGTASTEHGQLTAYNVLKKFHQAPNY